MWQLFNLKSMKDERAYSFGQAHSVLKPTFPRTAFPRSQQASRIQIEASSGLQTYRRGLGLCQGSCFPWKEQDERRRDE
jgi:hypothetical protein